MIIRSGYSQLPRHGTTTQRGYGRPHQLRRAQLLTNASGRPCPLCNQPMLPTDTLELDHTTPLAQNPFSRGDRIVHRHCNRTR